MLSDFVLSVLTREHLYTSLIGEIPSQLCLEYLQ